jgi:hypothetical protein
MGLPCIHRRVAGGCDNIRNSQTLTIRSTDRVLAPSSGRRLTAGAKPMAARSMLRVGGLSKVS